MQPIFPTADRWQSASLVRAGIIPTSPLKHSTGFTIRTISLYHKLFVRCPRLGVQPFAKAICDLEGVAFKPYLSSQIYAALDVYVAILNGVRHRTRKCLGREGRSWRIANACACCQHRLKEDPALEVRMLAEVDGNDTMKRVERKEDVFREQEEAGAELPTRSKERIDRRIAGDQYLLSRAETDYWDEDNWANIQADAVNFVSSSGEPSSEPSSELPSLPLAGSSSSSELPSLPSAGSSSGDSTFIWAESGCEDRWSNMQEKSTVKSAVKYCENGWFVMLCRHMMFLVGCDMVKTGER